MERTRSAGSVRTIARVRSLRSTRARVVTISVTYRPAGASRPPPGASIGPVEVGASVVGKAASAISRHRRRKEALVTPAMGASSTGVATSSGPMRSGAGAGPQALARGTEVVVSVVVTLTC